MAAVTPASPSSVPARRQEPPGPERATRGRLTMLATGSRGDVQPQIALAQRLHQAGYQLRLATHRSFAALVHGAGLELYPLAGDSERFFSGLGAVVMREHIADRRRVLDLFDRFLGPFIRRFLEECTEACQGTDAILYWPPSRVGPSLAEKLGVPCFAVATYPLPHCRTRAFANPFHAAGTRRLGGLGNYLSWAFGEPLWGRFFEQEVARWRRSALALPAASPRRERRCLRRLPHLLGFSPAVLPRPRDWPEWLHVTGYWFLDLASDWSAPDELVDFLAAGPPPVVIGFGSMAARDPRALTSTAVTALRRAGARGILLSGWGGLGRSELCDDILVLHDVPHDWLFPRAAGVVHHGGSGTTAAALRAGAPALTVPFGFDQHLWGRQLARCGAGLEPIPAAELSAERLAAAIRCLLDDAELRRRAAAMGRLIRAEDGAGRAAELVDHYLEQPAAVTAGEQLQ